MHSQHLKAELSTYRLDYAKGNSVKQLLVGQHCILSPQFLMSATVEDSSEHKNWLMYSQHLYSVLQRTVLHTRKGCIK